MYVPLRDAGHKPNRTSLDSEVDGSVIRTNKGSGINVRAEGTIKRISAASFISTHEHTRGYGDHSASIR
jgi:hypothetical protein